MNFGYKSSDRVFYEEKLADFLPREIIDVHTHVWLERFRVTAAQTERGVSWPSRVAADNSYEDLRKTNETLFPRSTVIPVIFGMPGNSYDLTSGNSYTAQCARQNGCPALMLTHPAMDASELERQVAGYGFAGIKVYFEYAPHYIPSPEIRIYDYLTHEHLRAADRNGWVVMLHIPRPARLRDPVNLAQMLEIDAMYPSAKVIIAHAGRAYCDRDMDGAMERLAETRNLLFDISANTNSCVFEALLRTVGPQRIMYGSDLPIFRMRGRRDTSGERYVNIVPAGLYGDVSDDPHMRESSGAEAESLTYMLYEELYAFRLACESIGLPRADIESVFFHNAAALFGTAEKEWSFK